MYVTLRVTFFKGIVRLHPGGGGGWDNEGERGRSPWETGQERFGRGGRLWAESGSMTRDWISLVE